MVATLISAGRKEPIVASKILTDDTSSCVRYEGKAESTDALTSDPVWQIKRIVTLADSIEEIYADNGNFTQVWDDRETLFPAPPPCPATGSVATTGQGVEIFNTSASVIPNSETDVLTYTVPTGTVLYLVRAEVASSNLGIIHIKVDGTINRSRYLNWTSFIAEFNYGGLSLGSQAIGSVLALTAGTVVTLSATNTSPDLDLADYQAYLQGTLVTL